MRVSSAFVLGWLVWLAAAPSTAHAEAPAFAGRNALIMVDKENCVWCKRWEEAVQPDYLASPEGKILPFVRLRRGHKDLAGLNGVGFAPTFVLIVNGRDVGRIVGYGGPDHFWAEIDRLFRRAGLPSSITVIRTKAKLNALSARMPS
jgi:hypothetical protein